MTDAELIDFVYTLAVQELTENDFNPEEDIWHRKIAALPDPLKFTYAIVVADQQLTRGGFDAWFVNAYAQFADITILGLREIGAHVMSDLFNVAFTEVYSYFDGYDAYRRGLIKGTLADLYQDDSILVRTLEIYSDAHDKMISSETEDWIALLADYLRNQGLEQENTTHNTA